MTSRNSPTASCDSSATVSPLATSYDAGTTSRAASASCCWLTPRCRRQGDAGEHVLTAEEHLLRALGREDQQRRARRTPAVELGRSGQGEDLAGAVDGVAAGGDDRDLVADVVARGLGGAGVEHDLVGALRPAAVDQLQRGLVEQVGVVVVVEGDGRGALAADEPVVLVEQVAPDPVDVAVGPLDLGQVGEPLDLLRRQHRAVAGTDRLEGAGAGRAHERVRGGALDDRVERRGQAGAEHHHAGEEADPEHDRERAHDEPDLARQQRAPREPEHLSPPAGSAGPSCPGSSHGSAGRAPRRSGRPRGRRRGRCTPPPRGRGSP